MFDFKRHLVNYLREAADRIDTGTSEVSETEAADILKVVAHKVLSKEQACNYLNLSRSRFDDLVREKKIPRGRKKVGFKELCWYEDELDMAAYRLQKDKKLGGGDFLLMLALTHILHPDRNNIRDIVKSWESGCELDNIV